MYFQTQSFLVAGLSRSGISAGEYLLSNGANVYLYDDVEEESVQFATQELEKKGATAVAKEELSRAVERCDVLVLSPGIPVDHPLPVAFRKAGKRIIGEAELGALALACPVVAVTGTNGKTTTVTMLERIFEAAHVKGVACGNIGKPITSCLKECENGVAIAEISSFQLETLYSLRPHVAVVLGIAEDHLNRHYNMENYVYLKSRLLKNSTESEYAVLNYDDERVRAFAQASKAKVVWFSVKERVDGGYLKDGNFCFRGEPLLKEREFPLEGSHNRIDALAAICAAKLMGIENEAIAEALKNFQGVKHRLQKLGTVDGVTFINDSKATNVDSTIQAIASVKGESVLLLGGKDKGYSYEQLFDEIKNSGVVHTVLYGENAFRILSCALKRGYERITLCRDFSLAVKIAYLTARRGQNVLLSPASASFDSFKSYEERGEKFALLMKELQEEAGDLREEG